jgi:predicted enzyme related to lactoylglutathione lyase
MNAHSSMHHTIHYIELYVTDIPKAKEFFSSAFQWEFNDYGPEYVGIRKRDSEGESGGICRSDTVVLGGPLVILYSSDLEASLAAVVLAGGKITKEIFSFPGGRRFEFCVPGGHEMAVWSDQ